MMCTHAAGLPSGENITPLKEAVDIACEALKPLGRKITSPPCRPGILEERWVDIIENKGKTSGAWLRVYDNDPSTSYDFKGHFEGYLYLGARRRTLHALLVYPEDAAVLSTAHSIFTAEVASTVNETLLIHLSAAEYGFPGDAEIPHQFLY